MRLALIVALVSWGSLSPAMALEYKGKSLDGIELEARAFYGGTGGVYDVRVVFQGERATLYFQGGSKTQIRLTTTVVNDPSEILGYGRLGYLYLNRSLGIGLESGGQDGPPAPPTALGADLWRLAIEPTQLEKIPADKRSRSFDPTGKQAGEFFAH